MTLKNEKITQETPFTAIYSILQDNKNAFFTIGEIMRLVFENREMNLTYHCIQDNLIHLMKTNQNIISRIERRGEKKQPITVFSLTNNL